MTATQPALELHDAPERHPQEIRVTHYLACPHCGASLHAERLPWEDAADALLETLHDADALDFPKSKRAAAYSAAFDIACLEGGNKPEKFDFARLVEHLAQKLPSLRRGE